LNNKGEAHGHGSLLLTAVTTLSISTTTPVTTWARSANILAQRAGDSAVIVAQPSRIDDIAAGLADDAGCQRRAQRATCHR
jgi:hypothetical protein